MYKECKILTPLLKIPFSIYTDEGIEWLYKKFVSEYKNNTITINGKKLSVRKYPPIRDKEETFMHLLCGKECKEIHSERAARMLWAKEIIISALNSNCRDDCIILDCNGLLIWKDSRRNNRIKIYHKKYNYIAIVDEKETEYVIVTGYYVIDSCMRKSFKDEYNKSSSKIKKQETPHISM